MVTTRLNEPRRRGAGQAVQKIDPSTLCEDRELELLAPHPRRAPSSVHRHRDSRDELAPSSVGRRFPIHKGGQPHVWTLLQQCRRQLACVRLEPAHLAWHEKDQIQPYVHLGAVPE
jgi:hypothetical protein